MKKLICFILVATALSSASAQTKSEIESFLYDREIPFNMDAKMVRVNDIDSITKIISKKNLSYTRYTFVFYGKDLKTATLSEYSSNTIVKSKNKPFRFYKFYKNKEGEFVVEGLSGSDSF